ncbi:hypothetical protein FJ250_12640, partial [bacterium]|nr:hypothetical protein [bacterium]
MWNNLRCGSRVRAALIAAAMAACGLLAACSNPTESRPEPKCDHVDADGIVVELTTATPDSLLANQWQGTVGGAIALEVGHAMSAVRVTFLDADSTRIVVSPDCDDHRLGWTVADTSLVDVAADGSDRWSVVLTPKRTGDTSVRFRVWHGDHADFTSLPIPVSIAPGDDPHAEAEGLRVELAGRALATVWQGASEGAVEVAAGDSTHVLAVRFLDADGDPFTPTGADFELVATVEGAAARVARAGDWSVRLHGLATGSATLTLTLMHDGHADYTAAPIAVEVLAPVAPPPALSVLEGHTHVASWNYDGDHAPAVAGALLVDAGETREGLDVRALGPWLTGAGHGASHRDALRLPNGRYRLECTVSGALVARITLTAGDPWGLRLEGLTAGVTSAVIRVLDGDQVALQTAALPVVVVAAGAGDAQADYFFKKNGVRCLYVVDGVVTAQPAACAAPANPGRLEVAAGDETDLP